MVGDALHLPFWETHAERSAFKGHEGNDAADRLRPPIDHGARGLEAQLLQVEGGSYEGPVGAPGGLKLLRRLPDVLRKAQLRPGHCQPKCTEVGFALLASISEAAVGVSRGRASDEAATGQPQIAA